MIEIGKYLTTTPDVKILDNICDMKVESTGMLDNGMYVVLMFILDPVTKYL
jgi:hypothetical protein